MAKPRRKDNNRTFLIGFLLLLAVILLMKISVYIFSPKIVVAEVGELSRTISTKGIVLRNEHLIISESQGSIIYEAPDGERIGKGKQVASVFFGNVDETLQLKINAINDRIRNFQIQSDNLAYYSGSSQQMETQIFNLTSSIIAARNGNNFEKVYETKQELISLVGKKNGTSKEDELAQLTLQRDELEKNMGDVKSGVLSPIAGVFVSKLDGYESQFENFDILSLKPESLQWQDTKLKSATKISNGDAVGKIIENYEWYYATQMSSKIAKSFTVGSTAKACFSDVSSNVISATVVANYDGDEGKKIVVFECHETVDSSSVFRWISAELSISSQRGLKIPKSAVVVENDITGVYIKNDGLAKFKPIEILISDDEYVIVKVTDVAGALKLYDQVLVETYDIHEGKKI